MFPQPAKKAREAQARAAQLPPGMPRLLRMPAVLKLTGLSRTSIYNYMGRGAFPKPRRLSENCIAWREDEVRAWLDQLPVDDGTGHGEAA
jgi:prophage regulatory protein